MYLVVDNESFAEPSIEQVTRAIQAMDNESRRWVALSQSSEEISPRIIASGGNKGRVMVSYVDEHKSDIPLTLVANSNADEADILLWTGQYAEFPAKYAVPKSMAIKAFRYFFQHLAMSPDLTWEE
jgi:hypothetical protein